MFEQYLFLKFVMKAQDHQENLDYEEDVDNLKRVWAQFKQPTKKTMKESLSKTQTATQTRLKQTKTKEVKESNEKSKTNKKNKPKVLISEPNFKQTIRNPKAQPQKIIEVVTHPEKRNSDPLRNQRFVSAPQKLILTNPQGVSLVESQGLRKQLAERDYELSLLRVSNTHNQDKVLRLEAQLELKQREIDDLKAKEHFLTSKLAEMGSKQFNFNYGKVEYENYRQDSRRLLRMLKATQQYQTFADLALEDDGVRFLTNASKTVKTKLDVAAGQSQIHFCTCNKAFIPESALWVPEKVYDFGKNFIKERQGNLSQTQLQLLLYELNKLWREREKRIFNHANAQKANQIGKYKRKLKEVSRGHSGPGIENKVEVKAE